MMSCSFTKQVLAQLDLFWCEHELRPAGVHGWLQVAAVETAVSETDIFASSTGNFNIITLDHLLKNNCSKVDLAGSVSLDGMKVDNNKPQKSVSLARTISSSTR